MVEHGDAVIAQRVRHGALAVDVVMVAEDREPAKRRLEARKDRGDGARRHAPAAEQLHVDVISAEQHEIGRDAGGFGDDRLEARDVVRMRPGVKIGKKGNAERARPSRPPRDLQMNMTDDVPLRAADSPDPALVAMLVAKRGTRDGAGQSTA